MPSSFSVYFPTPSGQDHALIAYNTGDRDVGFQISGEAPSIALAPNERISYMVKPIGLVLTDTQMSGILKGTTVDNNVSGQFFGYLENTTRIEKTFTYPKITFPAEWENQEFDLSWLRWIPNSTYTTFGKDVTAVYSFPHNLDPEEVTISGVISNSEKTVDYTVHYSGLHNEYSPDYTVSPNLPYALKVEYSIPDNNSPYNLRASGFESGWEYYPGGSSTTGISFSLPFYDQRENWDNIPATYKFYLNYRSPTATYNEATSLNVILNHAFIRDNFFADLHALALAQPKDENLHEVDIVDIPADIISRRRLAIGIEDIKSVERVFVKDGVYISTAYNLDFSIYTFSLKVDEFIPNYSNINRWETVKYYISFNNSDWERVSPIDREIESQGNTTIPKLFVFDKIDETIDTGVIKYIPANGIINNFRIKIVFDVSALGDAVFVPPEIRNYKCMIFDKQHFANFEA